MCPKATMLCKAKSLRGYKLNGLDGEIGGVKEFYFDDKHWTVRYLVADTGNWLSERQVLISPHALTAISPEDQNISIKLTKQQIEDSPSLLSDLPVSKQFEDAYYGYYGWPVYSDSPYEWGSYPHLVPISGENLPPSSLDNKWDSHLRSTNAVSGYHIQASDGEVGHVEDFLIDDDLWTIRYLVVDTRNWWPGKRLLISPQWIEQVNWDDSRVLVHLTQELIKQAPEYSDETVVTREYEAALHRHYYRQGYWVNEPAAKAMVL